MSPSDPFDRILRSALQYPETYPESPWGELVVKVHKKIFVFLGRGGGGLSVTLKLPLSNVAVLEHDWARPTPYGMGKHGWVSMSFPPGTPVPLGELRGWLAESFHAVAPKRLLKLLPPEGIGLAPELAPPPPPEPPVNDDDLAVLLVGTDPLRLDRARLALARLGHAALAVAVGDEALDIAGAAEPRLVVLDLSRDANEALALGPQLELLCPDGQLVVAGLRDAKQQRKVEGTVSDGAVLSKDAPGDPKLVGQLVALL